MYTQRKIQERNKYKYTYYRNTYTIIKTPTNYKSQIYTNPQVTKTTHTLKQILQDKL